MKTNNEQRTKPKTGRHFILRTLIVIPQILAIILISFFRFLFMDLPKNIKKSYDYPYNMEKRKAIKSDLETSKKVELLDDKVKRLERLVYSIFEDPEYPKKDRGKHDIKELSKDVK